MREHTIKLYKYEELTEKAKQKAIENLWDINVDYEWWDSVYEDAANIGLKITSFDIGRSNSIEGEFEESPGYVITKILSEHGEGTETYKTALRYRDTEWEFVDEDGDYDGENEDAISEFLHDLLEDYLVMLRNEYEYLTTKEAIEETIIANEYEFTEDGKLFWYNNI